MKRHWKVQNKKRLTCAVSALALIVVLCFQVMPRFAGADDGVREVIVTAQAGDTLWDLCTQYKPARYELRDYIEKVKYCNQKSDSSLSVGEQLRFPKR